MPHNVASDQGLQTLLTGFSIKNRIKSNKIDLTLLKLKWLFTENLLSPLFALETYMLYDIFEVRGITMHKCKRYGPDKLNL